MATPATRVSFDTQLIAEDMAVKGWHIRDLANRAKVSHSAASRFLAGVRQTAKTNKKIARALGYDAERYVIRRDRERVA